MKRMMRDLFITLAIVLAIGAFWKPLIRAAGTDVNQLLFIARALPGRTADGATPVGNIRAGSYREQYMQSVTPNKNVWADEGTYFIANNSAAGTPGAGIALGGATQTVFVATTPTATIFNSAQSPTRIYMDVADLVATAAGTAETNLQFAVVRDVGNRYSSGGTSLTVWKVNSGGNSSQATVFFGAITATAATASAVTISSGFFRPTVAAPAVVVGDNYLLQFGSVNNETSMPFSVTVAANITQGQPPVILNPNETLLIYTWGTGMTATPSAVPDLAWVER